MTQFLDNARYMDGTRNRRAAAAYIRDLKDPNGEYWESRMKSTRAKILQFICPEQWFILVDEIPEDAARPWTMQQLAAIFDRIWAYIVSRGMGPYLTSDLVAAGMKSEPELLPRMPANGDNPDYYESKD